MTTFISQSTDTTDTEDVQGIQDTPRGYAVGIDLGTTNSCVAIVRAADSAPEVLPNREGSRTTPSVVARTGAGASSTVLVGASAVAQEAKNPDSTKRSIKRYMGTSDQIWLGGEAYSPEQISAEILKKVKSDAESVLGGSVTDAVITVPAYFSNAQREATMAAGRLAGLNVLRIINEPTAASLAYGLDQAKNEKVLVYDLGGGTFDVTILAISDIGVFEVLGTNGDTQLGGDDFDDAIVSLILSSLYDEFIVVKSDAESKKRAAIHAESAKLVSEVFESPEDKRPLLQLDGAAMARLREAAEGAKKQLSATETVNVSLPYIAFRAPQVNVVNGIPQVIDAGGPVHIETTITRAEFEQEIQWLVDRTVDCVVFAMRDAKLAFRDIDEVVFVGGSTRVPNIGETIEKLTGRKPNRSVNPDEAVAVGAAVQAATLTGAIANGILLLDVTPLTLGIETYGGDFNPMISRNTTIPVEYTEEFSTAEDGQTKVDVKVYQGERPRCHDNIYLGEFHLADLVPAPRGVPKILVTFDVDASGILSVRAEDKATGRAHEVTITGKSSLNMADVNRILTDAKQNEEADLLYRQQSELKLTMHQQARQVEVLLTESRHALSEEVIEDLEETLTSLNDAQKNMIESTEIMRGIVAAAQESILDAGKSVYDKAEEVMSAAKAATATGTNRAN